METEYQVKVNMNVPTARVADSLCCAFEGGSNYWVQQVSVDWESTAAEALHEIRKAEGEDLWAHDAIANGVPAKVRFDGSETVNIDRASVMTGLQVMANDYPKHFRDLVECVDDAETGDVLLQCICFGELVFG